MLTEQCLGAHTYGRAADQPARSVLLARVRLNAGGYDTAGTYWGRGAPLWCATGTELYQQYVRASTRIEAAAMLGLTHGQLVRGGA